MSVPARGGWAILASGFSRRFGADKLLTPLPGSRKTVLEETLFAYRITPHPLAVVLRPDQQERVKCLPQDVAILTNPDAAEGMAAAIRCAVLGAHDQGLDWLGIGLGDMPWIQPDTLQALSARARADIIVRPVHTGSVPPSQSERNAASQKHHGIPGHPVVFGHEFFPALQQLAGDQGARNLLKAVPGEKMVCLPVQDPGCIQDVDTPEDLVAPPGWSC